MFSKIFALFALLAVALAAPSPKAAPEPSPQLLAYSAGFDYAYPAVGAPLVSPYAAPVVSPYAAYSAYPGAYFVR
ncbi:hypothetical protein NE865_02511 [Phthorimaea operculella]|nr:hypothetical protein NE865_02511 [Phthorimaea operculella]